MTRDGWLYLGGLGVVAIAALIVAIDRPSPEAPPPPARESVTYGAVRVPPPPASPVVECSRFCMLGPGHQVPRPIMNAADKAACEKDCRFLGR